MKQQTIPRISFGLHGAVCHAFPYQGTNLSTALSIYMSYSSQSPLPCWHQCSRLWQRMPRSFRYVSTTTLAMDCQCFFTASWTIFDLRDFQGCHRGLSVVFFFLSGFSFSFVLFFFFFETPRLRSQLLNPSIPKAQEPENFHRKYSNIYNLQIQIKF